ncbi:MAG: phosphopentomutase [Candidatus Aminicenantes bacterium]|nr:phosphopentomutase [Candidatus Aminicenantes bacterium]
MGKRVIIIVIDSVGVGYMDDAAEFGDIGANTLGNIAEKVGGLNLPNLKKLGLGNIIDIKGVDPVKYPAGKFGKIREASKGKDTMTGHWEMMGIISEEAFPLYPDGFPEEIINEFKERTGVKGILGNIAASGTKIIEELGAEHMRTGFPVIYTSGDSVFQIAAHNDTIPLGKLYEYCVQAREMCDKYKIGRVIARPFVGSDGAFKRTVDRRDYPMIPPEDTILDLIEKSGFVVSGIGKIEDIYARKGVSRAIHTKNNKDGMDVLMKEMSITKEGLIFVNLVDFDMLYGHRRNVEGYASALEEFDKMLGGFSGLLEQEDILVITADHGCDPTFKGTDHTREFIPLLVSGREISPEDLGIRRTFADIGVSTLHHLGINNPGFPGKSFI